MKTNGTRILIIALFLYLFLVIVSFSSYAQPDYTFKNKSLISGSDRQIGATYRFTNVKPGVDGIVTITDLTGGLTLEDVDGGSGFDEALQPVIRIPALSTGYAEFTIDFVKSGTFSPMTMLEVPLTCIDVDGRLYSGLPVSEFDEVKKTTGMFVDFNLLGGELNISFTKDWVLGKNIGIIDYPGVDTMAKQAMFSTISSNVEQMVVRTGAINLTTSSQQRLRSIYFKRFSYANSYLSKPALLSFRGIEKNKQVDLQWELQTDHNINTVTIEKSKNGSSFSGIADVWVNNDSKNNGSFRYTDHEAVEGNTLYRLKMVSANGTVQYSNILAFRSNGQSNTTFKVYPSAIESSATVNVRAEKAGSGVFELVDYAGRIIHRQNVSVQQGSNNIQLNSISNVIGGNYVAVLKIDNNTYTQKILKK